MTMLMTESVFVRIVEFVSNDALIQRYILEDIDIECAMAKLSRSTTTRNSWLSKKVSDAFLLLCVVLRLDRVFYGGGGEDCESCSCHGRK